MNELIEINEIINKIKADYTQHSNEDEVKKQQTNKEEKKKLKLRLRIRNIKNQITQRKNILRKHELIQKYISDIENLNGEEKFTKEGKEILEETAVKMKKFGLEQQNEEELEKIEKELTELAELEKDEEKINNFINKYKLNNELPSENIKNQESIN